MRTDLPSGRGANERAWAFTAALIVLLFSSAPASLGFTHPQAVNQPTARGKTINTLQAWHGGLYAGYGDYGQNTGPVAITRFDTTTRTFGAPFWASTEAIEAYRIMYGNLYAPYTDPLRLSAGTPDYAAAPWRTEVNGFASAHVFDAVDQPSTGAIWMAGSDSGSPNGTIWRSTDRGVTWQEMLSVPPPDGDPNNFVRFYFLAAYRGQIIAQPTSRMLHPMQAFVYENGTWTRRPALGYFPYKAKVFAGKLLYQSSPNGAVHALDEGDLHAAEDYVSGDGAIWVLDRQAVYKTNDLLTWQQVATAPDRATSIAVQNGAIWVGTSEAEILRLNQ
jgi:hypothetical protein